MVEQMADVTQLTAPLMAVLLSNFPLHSQQALVGISSALSEKITAGNDEPP